MFETLLVIKVAAGEVDQVCKSLNREVVVCRTQSDLLRLLPATDAAPLLMPTCPPPVALEGRRH